MLAQLHRQLLDFLRPLTCDSLRNSVTPPEGRARGETFSLYSQRAERKYLNRAERERALRALNSLALDRPLFAQLLAWTGGRVSEVLALTACTFQLDEGIVSIVTLKQRKVSVREVPLPPSLMDALNEFFDLRRLQQGSGSLLRLWPFCRMTAWRFVKEAMKRAKVAGPQACPKGFRHGFGVYSLQAGVPVTLVQRWMGHSWLTTTSIYLDVSGPEEMSFARRFWSTNDASSHVHGRAQIPSNCCGCCHRSQPPHRPVRPRAITAGARKRCGLDVSATAKMRVWEESHQRQQALRDQPASQRAL